jgi:hypothetical protein
MDVGSARDPHDHGVPAVREDDERVEPDGMTHEGQVAHQQAVPERHQRVDRIPRRSPVSPREVNVGASPFSTLIIPAKCPK